MLDSVWSEDCEKQLGFDLGVAASAAFYTVKLLAPESHTLATREFETRHVDCHYSDMLLPLKRQGIDNSACFFMLSEFLSQLNAIFALSENGMFDDVLRMKYGTVVLFAFDGSVLRFANRVMSEPSGYGFTADGALALSNLVPREIRKRVNAAKDLRNAFVHYDFSGLLGMQACKGKDANEVIAEATRKTVKMDPEDYLFWLDKSMEVTAKRIDDLISLSVSSKG